MGKFLNAHASTKQNKLEQIRRELYSKGTVTIPVGTPIEVVDAVLRGGRESVKRASGVAEDSKVHAKMAKHSVKQLFRLSAELIDSVSTDEVQATLKDMIELGIAKAPFPVYSISAPANKVLKVYEQLTKQYLPDDELSDTTHGYEIIYHIDHEKDTLMMEIVHTKEQFSIADVSTYVQDMRKRGTLDNTDGQNVIDSIPMAAQRLEQLLIVLLATRNVVKEVKRNRLAKFGIGKQRAEYTTTLKIGRIVESVSEGPSSSDPNAPHGTKRPHLRRGHIRRQHYGPGNQYVRQVFIEPCFVNCDETFINNRTAYNVSK